MSYVIVFNKNGMGVADEKLSHTLAKNYITLINEEPEKPHALLFYAEGVNLLTKKSPLIEALKKTEKLGIKIIACKTCLQYYQISDKIEVGMMGTMQDIINYQIQAEKVISV